MEEVATFYLVISNKNTYIPNNTGVAIPTPITTFGSLFQRLVKNSI
jgi:hypothetical protein